jgi:hypothetical protein
MSKKNRNQNAHPPNLHYMNIEAKLRHARGVSRSQKEMAAKIVMAKVIDRQLDQELRRLIDRD